MGKKIKLFRDEYRWLSNFWPLPFILNEKEWPTVEHWFQARKSDDLEVQEHIRRLSTPGKAKRYGKTIALREDWDEIRVAVMYQGVFAKFDQNKDLREKLVNTGNTHLEEGNTWGDKYWGVYNGEGLNYLGRILMDVRRYLKRREKDLT